MCDRVGCCPRSSRSGSGPKVTKCLPTHLEIAELGEGVDDDTEDDVEADGRDADEERHLEEREDGELVEAVLLAPAMYCSNSDFKT